MNTLNYIEETNYKNHNFSIKKNANQIEKFISKIKGILLSLKTTGFLSTLSFFFFTRKYRHLQVTAFSCISDKKEIYYFKSGKNTVSLRNKYDKSDLNDVFIISSEEYNKLGKINRYRDIEIPDQKIWITKVIGLLYFLRFGKSLYNTHLLGSGKFAAGVIVPNILKNKGRITKIKLTRGKSSKFIAESFGINKNVLDPNFFKFNYKNAKSNLFILSSPQNHVQDILDSIKSGYKKIYCEKPVGINKDDLNILRGLNNIDDINITFGFNRRFAPSIIYLKNQIEHLKAYHISYLVRLAEFSESMSRFKKGGGTTVCSCCHYLDLLTFLSGEHKFFDVNELIKDEVKDIDGYSFQLFIKHSNNITSSLRFIKASPGFRGKFQEEIILSSAEYEYKIMDFKEVYKNGLSIRKFRKDIKGWNLMVNNFLKGELNKSSTLKEALYNLEFCLKVDKLLQEMKN